MLEFSVFKTSWGFFGFVARGERLVATFLPGPEREVRRAIAAKYAEAVEAKNFLPEFRRQVLDYFAGRPTRFDVKVDLTALPLFRRTVLQACHRVPFGQTVSYKELAQRVGKPKATRAVGGAMAHNPIPLVIPCHRVLRSDASLGGFSSRGGVSEKERLLKLERNDAH